MKGVRGIVARAEWNDELSAQLHSETPKQFFDQAGHAKWRWSRIGKRPNHLWDCFAMNLVLACAAGCLGDVVAPEGP